MSSDSMHISDAVAKLWVKNYQDGICQVLKPYSSDPAVGETKAIWYDINGWTEMTNELVSLGATGIRIYFAAYSETSTLPEEDIPEGAEKNLTLVLVGTKKNEQGVEVDLGFDEVNQQGEEGASYGGPGGGAFDTGVPCPPSLSCSGDGSRLP